MNKQAIAYPIEDRWSHLWLFLVVVLGVFSLSIGKWLMPMKGRSFIGRVGRPRRKFVYLYLVASSTFTLMSQVALWLLSNLAFQNPR